MVVNFRRQLAEVDVQHPAKRLAPLAFELVSLPSRIQGPAFDESVEDPGQSTEQFALIVIDSAWSKVATLMVAESYVDEVRPMGNGSQS